MYAGDGLGLVDYTPTGVRFGVAIPTCMTQDEKNAANLICYAYTVQQNEKPIRGVGQSDILFTGAQVQQMEESYAAQQVSPYMPADSRFAGQLACAVKDTPLCPTAPTCMDDATAWAVAGCIAKQYAGTEHQQWCEGGLGPLFYAQAPFCTPQNLPPVPSCLDEQSATGRDYCRAHPGADGPDPTLNALCWLGMHDSNWWSQYNNAPTCQVAQTPPPPQPIPAPPPPPPEVLAPPPLPPPPPEKRSTATMGIFGILGLVAAGGAGYYMWQKRKKGK
jgi:hypothetical protein